jgi:hypothetical protein
LIKYREQPKTGALKNSTHKQSESLLDGKGNILWKVQSREEDLSLEREICGFELTGILGRSQTQKNGREGDSAKSVRKSFFIHIIFRTVASKIQDTNKRTYSRRKAQKRATAVHYHTSKYVDAQRE